MNCREEFEKWYTGNNTDSKSLLREPGGHYALMQTQLSYMAFEAAWDIQQETINELTIYWGGDDE